MLLLTPLLRSVGKLEGGVELPSGAVAVAVGVSGVTRKPDEPMGVVERLAVRLESLVDESISGKRVSSEDCPIGMSPPRKFVLVENRSPAVGLFPMVEESWPGSLMIITIGTI